MLANEDQKLILCNYNQKVHHKIFMELHDFIRISSAVNNFELNLQNCFSEAPIKFTIDQQTMLNIRIVVEELETNNIMMSPEAVCTMKTMKASLDKDKHPSLARLEKQLNRGSVISLLKFFNSDNNYLNEEMSSNLIDQVTMNLYSKWILASAHS